MEDKLFKELYPEAKRKSPQVQETNSAKSTPTLDLDDARETHKGPTPTPPDLKT